MRRILLFVLLAAALALACSKVSRKNFDRVENGMTFAEVVEILGEPKESSSAGFGPFSASTAEWEGKDGWISIQFVNEKVQVKTFHTQRPDDG